jgi:hypothetical protein
MNLDCAGRLGFGCERVPGVVVGPQLNVGLIRVDSHVSLYALTSAETAVSWKPVYVHSERSQSVPARPVPVSLLPRPVRPASSGATQQSLHVWSRSCW